MVVGRPSALENAAAVADVSAQGIKILDANNFATAPRHVDVVKEERMTPIFFALDSRSSNV